MALARSTGRLRRAYRVRQRLHHVHVRNMADVRGGAREALPRGEFPSSARARRVHARNLQRGDAGFVVCDSRRFGGSRTSGDPRDGIRATSPGLELGGSDGRRRGGSGRRRVHPRD